MIQRIQSVFLFLSSGALGSSFVFPFANSLDKSQLYFEDGLFNVHDNIILLSLTAISVILCLITIFLYNNRKLQLNFCVLAFLLMGSIIGMLLYSLSQVSDFVLDFGIASPLLGLILTALAFIFIRKDEKLVKSMDRLR